MTDSTNPDNCTNNSNGALQRIACNLENRARCEVLETDILTLAGQLNAANYRFLKMLAEFDEKGSWHGSDIRSFAHWLNWKVGMGSVMAREKVRVARALEDLPMIDAAFASGEVSYSKVRAMTRVLIGVATERLQSLPQIEKTVYFHRIFVGAESRHQRIQAHMQNLSFDLLSDYSAANNDAVGVYYVVENQAINTLKR